MWSKRSEMPDHYVDEACQRQTRVKAAAMDFVKTKSGLQGSSVVNPTPLGFGPKKLETMPGKSTLFDDRGQAVPRKRPLSLSDAGVPGARRPFGREQVRGPSSGSTPARSFS